MADRRRLFFDIETSPNIGVFWRAGYKEQIPYENIIKERAIICIAYKWEGERKVHSLTWDEKQNDKKMLLEFVTVANTADELVAHNGDRFDLKWIRTRCLYHGIQMFPQYTSIDTLKLARQLFLFNSNRLDYVAKYLSVGGKMETGFSLWKDILLENCPNAMRKMVRYCKHDVNILESVFKHLWQHAKAKTHYGALETGSNAGCPECGSLSIVRNKVRATAAGNRVVQMKCNDCGKYHQRPDR